MPKRFLAFGLSAWIVFASAAAYAANCGEITQAVGEPQIVRSGRTIPATVGTPLQEGDVIRSPKGSSANFSVNGVAGLSAGEGTECEITSSGEIMKVTLELGELRANIKKLPAGSAFSVETPTAIAAVRGTQFSSKVTMNARNLPDSSFAVRDSVVDVTVKSSGQKIELQKGFALDVPSIQTGAPASRQATGTELMGMEGTSLITACA